VESSSSTPQDGGNSSAGASPFSSPQISLPTGGGAIRGIGEKFTANSATGTGSLQVPIAVSSGRSGFGPQLSLSYDSGLGNGPFGIGWNLSLPAITRKTDKGLPHYGDDEESDVFILSGAEDLVPALNENGPGQWVADEFERDSYRIKRYRPRIEGVFARIERWTRLEDGDAHWRSISKDNTLTVYGRGPDSRISDPCNRHHVFSWLICESYDDKGNAIVYEYVAENDAGVDFAQPNERNRERTANRYLKRIRYGNRQPLLLDVTVPSFRRSHTDVPALETADWMFEAVLDYGDGHYGDEPVGDDGWVWAHVNPQAESGCDWPIRKDPFSVYRSGFEVRSYRLCQRVLMFHHFPEKLGAGDYLVRSTEFQYDEKPIGSFITKIIQSGYTLDHGSRYRKKSMPALEVAYTQSPLEDGDYSKYEVREADPANLPEGIDGENYKWLDLDGEGISGVLVEQEDAWYYKPNAGHGHFRPLELITRRPSLAALSQGKQQLLDLAGDGSLDLVLLNSPTPGFYDRTIDEGWGHFRTFRSLPVLDWNDPNLRFVDVTGDGIADILITEDDAFIWHPSFLDEGFGAAVRVPVPYDERSGPHVVFADGAQSVYLADMTGDGLSDMVRIRNGEVCYWPNLGYGKFGRKVTMDNSPWFEDPDLFDQKRIKLADTDGSGTTDILYIGQESIRAFLNRSGNAWSDARVLPQCAAGNDATSVSVVDFLGRGSSCLLWSSALPSDSGRPLRYVDLMAGKKPHLLVSVRNNLGAETLIEYASSTEFYLADKAAGTPWVTRLPFPVHVVKRVETYDYISRNRFVRQYSFHHGYFDGVEREFRGFGRVDQLDTEEFATLTASGKFPVGENVKAESNVPPALTKTWFHTGVFLDSGRISRYLAHEYYREPELSEQEEELMLLDDTILPENLSGEEAREACRALKGSILRQEVYALDGNEKSALPYTVSEDNYTLRTVQPRDCNRHAVFFAHPREAIQFNYERTLYHTAGRRRPDPRVSHDAVLEADEYGNVLKSVSIGYARRFPDSSSLLTDADRFKQSGILATLTESSYTNTAREADAYRAPLLAQTRTYELTGLKPDAHRPDVTSLFRFQELRRKTGRATGDEAHDRLYRDLDVDHAGDTEGGFRRRLFRQSRTLYRSDALDRILPLGVLQPLALPGEDYSLALTPALLKDVYRRRGPDGQPEDLLPDPAAVLCNAGAYVDLEGNGHWWTQSGRVFFSPNPTDHAGEELAHAQHHFFLPNRFVDPFGNISTVGYDSHDLRPVLTRDSVGNVTRAKNDYRVLAPRLVTDPNGNRGEVAFDSLGMVAGTAVKGKKGEHQGDSLEGFVADLDERTVLAHLYDPLRNPAAILQKATIRMVYDLFAFARSQGLSQPEPSAVYALLRETHESDLRHGESSKIQHAFSYSDGFGRQVQKKMQGDSAPADKPVWVGSGWTIFNNKGNPVRQYEPFVSATHRFEFARIEGVSPIFFYDPIERLIATLHPNHTYEKVAFDPWRHETWDANDTVLRIAADDLDVGDFIRRVAEENYLPTWYSLRGSGALGAEEQAAASQAAVHADTPALDFLDTLGRPFLKIAQNRFLREGAAVEERLATQLELDIEGNTRAIVDALQRKSITYDYNLLMTRIHQDSIDAGERWTLYDVAAKPLLTWDSRDHRLRREYDALRRFTALFVQTGESEEIQTERTVYGEDQSDDAALNLRGRVFQQFDGAGVVTTQPYDFKGNLLSSRRQLLVHYEHDADWSRSVEFEDRVFINSTTYDALNRAITLTTPDGSVLRPAYDKANLLQRLDVNLRGAAATTRFVSAIRYNARRQRTLVKYGNGARTRYRYDRLTLRLTRIRTARPGHRAVVQDLSYIYDPIGNITSIADAAQQDVYFKNQVVSAANQYVYDAVYRLIHAEGRELIGLLGQPHTTDEDHLRKHQPLPSDGHAMRRYREYYDYDLVGNILRIVHRATDGDWTRGYFYEEAYRRNNRLTGTRIGETREVYAYDPDGNMVHMPHLVDMGWDYKDQLHMTRRQVVHEGRGEHTYYVYDSAGRRIRKVTEGARGHKKHERIYLGSFELFREYGEGRAVTLERETLHVMDDKHRVALVETKTIDKDPRVSRWRNTLIRYQLANHLDSSLLELDQAGAIISYEEYYAYGSTSYQAVRSGIEASPKRYRYTGKERDEETGLYYFGARYYAPWLGRWTACDPAGPVDGTDLYVFARCNPVVLQDPNGKQAWLGQLTHEWNEAVDSVDKFTDHVEDVAIGAGGAVLDLAVGSTKMLVNPIGTSIEIGQQMSKAYSENGGGFSGVAGAINVVNPVYMALVAGYETKEAWDRGDYKAVGKQSVNTVVGVVGTVGIALGGAGLATRGLGLGAAATDAIAGDAAAGAPKPVAPAAAGDAAAAPKPPAGTGAATDTATTPKPAPNPAAAADGASAPKVPSASGPADPAGAPAQGAAPPAQPPTTPPVPKEGTYKFPDQKAPGKDYIGQSNDIPRRLGQHGRSGRYDPATPATTKAVPGGKFAREVAEQNQITDAGGIKGGKLSNKVNPIGVKREAAAAAHGLKPVIR
jgi:RHS repeat-associated protein